MDTADIPSLLSRLSSSEDAMRKMAVFKLQSSINDPSFADLFISSGGLQILRRLIMTTGGNTLAYSLQSLSRLLEVDMGWEIFEQPGSGELVERTVELIVTHPLVNILRGAMSILVAIVSHSQSPTGKLQAPTSFGFRALKPAVAVYPQFFEMVVTQLNSADHALCANALMLLNALMRDAISNDTTNQKDGAGKGGGGGEEWPKFIKRLQDMGVVQAVYVLVQSSALQDLAHPLLEFQALSKVLLRKWRDVKVDLERPEHRRALKGLHISSAPEKKDTSHSQAGSANRAEEVGEGNGRKGSRRHNPEKWRRLGFETESPAWEFDSTGYLGMMDLMDYVRKEEDGFQKLLLEQSSRPLHERCPITRASLAVTSILYDHFEVDKSDAEDAKAFLVLDGMNNYDKIFHPLILQWSRLHVAGLHSFFRLWKATGAVQDDFGKVAELVRILVDQVVGQATRTKDVHEVEEEFSEFEYHRLREVQMALLEMAFEEQWGHHLQEVREELEQEALQFVKEQRTRCLLQGAWFPRNVMRKVDQESSVSWRFLKLSHNRRYLHYADFSAQLDYAPALEHLSEKVDLALISSVVSNVSAINSEFDNDGDGSSISSNSTFKTKPTNNSNYNAINSNKNKTKKPKLSKTKITINSYIAPPLLSDTDAERESMNERPILTLHPQTNSVASEWLDGLLMLLSQKPITTETIRMIEAAAGYGLKIRLLNVRMDHGFDENGAVMEGRGVVPSREGLGDDYFYEALV